MAASAKSHFVWIAAIIVLACFSAGAQSARAATDSIAAPKALIDICRADLAARLNVEIKAVTVVKAEPATFPDASLGLPQPGQFYAEVITHGFRIVLEAAHTRYLYAAAGKKARYGGSLPSWKHSALYLEPIPDEPNMNGDLVQLSLAGTNPGILMRGVSSFFPQADGSVIATRGTSRSGHDLLYLKAGQKDSPERLESAFDYGEAAVSPDGAKWAAFSRITVGAPWTLSLGGFDAASTKYIPLTLPAGSRPQRLFWTGAQPVIAVLVEGKLASYELTGSAEALPWKALESYRIPSERPVLLNKSETLEVTQISVDGKDAVKVARVWFTGDEKILAVIEGISLAHFSVTPDLRFVLIAGKGADDLYAARAVDVATGEVLETVTGARSAAKLLEAPPSAARELMDAR